MANSDETDLVDVGKLPPEEDITEARRKVSEEEAPEPSTTQRDRDDDEGGEDPFAMQMEPPKPGHTTIASLRERLAAFLVDMGVLWLLFWGCLFIFHKVTTHNWIGPVPTMGTVALFFHGAFLFLAFLYFFLLEAAFFATIGKFCCWMYVRRKDGRHAGAFGVFIRNFFRLIELLTAGLLTWVPMELSRHHQRLGDMAGGTIVIKKHSANARYYNLDADQLASAFGRSIAQFIDLALVLIWLVGYIMLINYKVIILSQWLVLLFPISFILFWTLVQVILETTPGLWLIGYTITHEDGGRLTFGGALLRVLLSPLNLLMGLPCMLLSLRKQTVGDVIAATVVSRQRRRWRGAIGTLVVMAFCVGLVALGLFINPLNNVFRAGPDFNLSFMPQIEGLPNLESATSTEPSVISLRNFRFGVNDPGTLRTPPMYEPGETVYLLFEIYGYTRKDRLVWIQEDLMVQYPDGTIGLKQENVVDYHQIVKPGGGQIELTNNIALPPNAAPGTYVVTVTLRDMLANNFAVTETQSFIVKAPMTTTSPLEAPPPAPTSPLPVEPSGETQPPAAPAIEGQGEGAPPPAPTVPSSPIPVVPSASTPPTEVPPAPAGGFTVLPGPTLAPKQETAPPPSIPVPAPSALPPADQYGAKAVEQPIAPVPAPSSPSTPSTSATPTPPSETTPTPPAVPAPVAPVTAPAGTPTPPAPTPAIIEKTLTPTVSPADTHAKPVAPAVAPPVVVPSAPAAAPTQSPPKPAPATQPKAKVAPKPAAAKSETDQELKKAAEQELQQMAPAKAATPAKPAADIPSASSVKQQTEQPPATPKPKKKKASSGGSSSGGYMP